MNTTPSNTRQIRFPSGSVTLEQRLWADVEKGGADDCWPWKGATNNHKHGQFTLNRTGYYAHRVSFELANGPIPDGLMVCHHCDNPPCCNPAHLYAGNARQNRMDAINRNRISIFLSPENVALIRKARAAGISVSRIAARLNVPWITVRNVERGRTFSEITQDTPEIEVRPEDFPILTRRKPVAQKRDMEKMVAAMKAIKSGKAIREISQEIGYTKRHLRRLRDGKSGIMVAQIMAALENG